MNESMKFPLESRFFGLRRFAGRRSLIGVLVVLLLGVMLYLMLRQPLVQRAGGGLQLLGQTLQAGVERMLNTYFGPEVLLRQRARLLVRTLNGEAERLHWLEAESTTVVTTMDATLPALHSQLDTARAALLPLATTIQRGQLKGVSGQPLRPAQVETLVAEKLQAFTALEQQVALYEQTKQLHLATAMRARQLQAEAQRRVANLEMYLTLFEATAPLAENDDETDEHWSAIRTEFQAQLDQASTLTASRQALEQNLANTRFALTSVDRLLVDSTELTAQLRQLTVEAKR